MGIKKVESAAVMNDINRWVSEMATLHQQLKPDTSKPSYSPIPTLGTIEKEIRERKIRNCYQNTRTWIQPTDLKVKEEIHSNNWSALVENIRDGIENSLATILSAYQEPGSQLPVMIDRYRLPDAALEVSHAMLAITEQVQRMNCLLSYVINKKPSTAAITVKYSGESILKNLKELDISSAGMFRDLRTTTMKGPEADVSVLAAVAEESATAWTREDLEEYLSAEESNVRTMKWKGSVIGFVLYTELDDHTSVEPPVFDICFDNTEMNVEILKLLAKGLPEGDGTILVTVSEENRSKVELFQLAGFKDEEEETGLDTVTHVMTKGVSPSEERGVLEKSKVAIGIVHIVNHGDWNIVEPDGFQI